MTQKERTLARALEERGLPPINHARPAAGAEPHGLTPQEILRKLKERDYGNDARPAVKPVKLDSRIKPHPKKTVVASLKRFMNLREEKIERQTKEGDLLSRAEQARLLAQRLADPVQVAQYIEELNQEADDGTRRYQARLNESKLFWYGPDGLQWLAAKKNMEPIDWLPYAEFMDEAALRALAALFERDLLQRFVKSVQ